MTSCMGRARTSVDFICEQQHLHGRLLWPHDGITLHTANPDARDQMTRAIERYAREHCMSIAHDPERQTPVPLHAPHIRPACRRLRASATVARCDSSA